MFVNIYSKKKKKKKKSSEMNHKSNVKGTGNVFSDTSPSLTPNISYEIKIIHKFEKLKSISQSYQCVYGYIYLFLSVV